jgi:hypothetical protein
MAGRISPAKPSGKRGKTEVVSERRLALNTPLLALAGMLAVVAGWVQSQYTIGLQSPIAVRLRSPIVLTERPIDADQAEADQQGRRLSGWQRYTCGKFGRDCRLALAIQRAENPQGECEVYHYNANGTLDWGYFQINTVHLQRPDVNLRDLLDCGANIDFAYKLYVEKGGFGPWSTYKNGRYRQFFAKP